MPRHAPSPGWVLLPAIAAVAGHVGFCALLLAKWRALEQEVADGAPLVFANVSAALPDSVNPVGPHWSVVFAPSWIGEVVVMTAAGLALAIRTHERLNLRLLHLNSIWQAVMNCLFKLLLLFRLESDAGSWLLVFAPIYAAAAMQAVLHYQKTPDRRHRRPGFPMGIPHLIAIVVSFKLAGVFAYDDSSWAGVLWPLWALGGFLAGSLLLGVCCGLPLLLRRDMQVQMSFFLLAILALLLAVFVPGLLSTMRLTAWLDGSRTISASMIMLPAITAFSTILLILLLSLACLSHSRARRLDVDDADDDAEADESVAGALLSSLPRPKLLVRESATLFRRVAEDHEQLASSRLDDDAGGGVQLADMEEGRGGTPVERAPNADAGADADADASGGEAARGAEGGLRTRPSPAQDAPDGADGVAPPDGHAVADDSAPGTAPGPGDGLADAGTCWICCVNACDAVLLECGHGGLCMECANRCWKQPKRRGGGICPMCRAPITFVVKVDPDGDEGVHRVLQ